MESDMKASLKILAVMMAVGFGVAAAMAHGDFKHVAGIVEKVSPDSVTVKTSDGKSVEVKLVAATTYVLHIATAPGAAADPSQDKPAKFSDLAVGDHVLIHARPKGDTLEAAEVKFSAPQAAAPANKP
jgi:hypothetical protein